jgi:hypothetical protein
MTWQAIWNEGRIMRNGRVPHDRPLPDMTLWLEMTGPTRPSTRQRRGPRRKEGIPLRLWRGWAAEAGRAITVYLMADNAIRLVHGDIDLCSDPDMMRPGETVGLRYVTCHEGRNDSLEITNYDRGFCQSLRTGLAHRATLAEAYPAHDGYLKTAHIAAVAPCVVPATDLPGIEGGALVSTVQGPRPVETITEGDLVFDAAGETHTVRWIEERPRLCMGRNGPMRLRAPYFGLERDLVLTPETRLLQTGPVVDYLCGTAAVLARVGDLANGRMVFRDRQNPIRTFFHIMLDDPACIMVDGGHVETAHLGDVMALGDPLLGPSANPSPRDMTASLPLLDRATARALLTAHSRAA